VPSRDVIEKTKKGLLRTSSGHVTYSASDRMRFELDAAELIRILREVRPHSSPSWTLVALEKVFQDHTGRRGCWIRNHLPIGVFLTLFPRTFEAFGGNGEFVRILHRSRTHVVDNGDDTMVRLALVCQRGFVDQQPPSAMSSTRRGSPTENVKLLPELLDVKTKVRFETHHKPHGTPAMRKACSLPSLGQVDETIHLPLMARADTQPFVRLTHDTIKLSLSMQGEGQFSDDLLVSGIVQA